MRKAQVDTLSYDEFVSQIINGRFMGYIISREGQAYYINNGNGVEYEMLPSDVLILLHDYIVGTVDFKDVIFI